MPDRGLRELNFGELEGRTWEECTVRVRNGLMGFDEFHAPGGESVADLRRRVLGFLGTLPQGDHVVFTHGGVIRVLLREAGRDGAVPPGEVERVVL